MGLVVTVARVVLTVVAGGFVVEARIRMLAGMNTTVPEMDGPACTGKTLRVVWILYGAVISRSTGCGTSPAVATA